MIPEPKNSMLAHSGGLILSPPAAPSKEVAWAKDFLRESVQEMSVKVWGVKLKQTTIRGNFQGCHF